MVFKMLMLGLHRLVLKPLFPYFKAIPHTDESLVP